MKGIPWNIRIDASRDIAAVVVAENWCEARALACAKLNVAPQRLRVSQPSGPSRVEVMNGLAQKAQVEKA